MSKTTNIKFYLEKIPSLFRRNPINPSSLEKEPKITKLSFPPIEDIPRGSTLYAVDHFEDRPIIFCEVGVYLGENSLNVIQTLNVKKAYLIDMYEEHTTNYNETSLLIPQSFQDNAFKNAEKNLKSFENKITWILKYSNDAIEELPDNIDFIYIDANHEYKHVKNDIETYWRKVSENGILAGHDLFGTYNGVINAVHEFAMKNRLHIHSNLYDWWFIKGKTMRAHEVID